MVKPLVPTTKEGLQAGNHSQGGRPLQDESMAVDPRTDVRVNIASQANKTWPARRNPFAHQPIRNLLHGSETAAVPFGSGLFDVCSPGVETQTDQSLKYGHSSYRRNQNQSRRPGIKPTRQPIPQPPRTSTPTRRAGTNNPTQNRKKQKIPAPTNPGPANTYNPTHPNHSANSLTTKQTQNIIEVAGWAQNLACSTQPPERSIAKPGRNQVREKDTPPRPAIRRRKIDRPVAAPQSALVQRRTMPRVQTSARADTPILGYRFPTGKRGQPGPATQDPRANTHPVAATSTHRPVAIKRGPSVRPTPTTK